MAKTSIVQRIKNWLTGGSSGSKGSKSSGSKSTASSSQPKKKKKKSEEVVERQTERFNKRELVNNVRNTTVKEEPQKQEEAKPDFTEKYKATKRTYKSMSGKDSGLADALNKKVDKLSEIKESNKKTPPKPKSIAKPELTEKQELIEKARANRELKRAESRDRRKADRNARLAERLEKHEAFHSATNHRYDVGEKGISKEERQRRIANVQTATLGEMMYGRDDEALDVMKARMKYDRVGESARRGLVNAATANALNFAEKRFNKDNRREAEEYYQANKHKGAEIGGSLAGGLLLYGGTAGTFENLGGNAIGRAAETQLGKRLGAEALQRTMAGTGVKAALARSLVGDAIQDSTIGLLDTTLDVAQRDDLKTAGDYAKAMAQGQAANYAMGLAGNAVSHALPVAGRAVRNAWGNFADESRRLNIVPKGVADIAEATADGAKAKPKMKTVIENNLDVETRSALIAESSDLDDEWWAIRESIEQEYGSINPNYRELSPEQRADVASKKTRMQEITARRNEIAENLRIVRRVEEPSKATEIPKGTVQPSETLEEVMPESSVADAKTYAEFVEANKKDAGVIERIKAGENPKDIWQNARIERGRENIHLTPLNDAKKALYDYIPENEVQGWFNDANSGYKPRIVERIAENPDALNASMNVAYRNYLDTDPKNVMSFDEWLDTPQTYYRGTRGQAKTDDDVFSGFTPNREVAEKFAGKNGKVDEIKISPRQTYGSIMTNGESEILVPESAIRQYAKEIKTSKSDPLKNYKNNRLKENPDAKFDEAKKQKTTKSDVKQTVRAEPPKTKAAEAPETAVVAKSEEVGAGEEPKTGAGERTEFKRSEEPSAKEQARNKRAEKRTKATQEGFDRDFAEFTKKINENREKVSKLNGRLRAATTEAEQQAIRDEIKALDDEIKQMHRRASLKYHPDMGGTNEWAQKFNDAFRDYSKRVYSSPNFSGASSKSSAGSTRNNTYKEYRQRYKNAGGSTPPPKAGAGGGGANTPPPKDGIGNYDGLRRPKGYAKRTQRAMNSVEDMVGASKAKKGWRETLRQFKDEANRKFVDSLKDFEEVARDLKSTKGKEAMQKLYGAIDKARRYRAVATTSVGSHQMKWDGTRYQVKGEDGVMRDAPSIAEIFSGMDKETERSFNAYLLLKHNVDRLREGKPIFDNTVIYNEELSKRLGLPKDIDLMDADVCKKLAQDYEARFPEFKNRAAQVRQYTANELNNRVQAGLLSKEKMDEWLHDHPDYVPTYREGLFDGVGGIKGSALGASDLKAAKGSDLNIYDIKEQLADATVRNWRDISLNNLLEKTFGDNIMKMAASAEVSPYTFALDHTMNVGKAADGGKYYANIFRDGKAERVEIDKRFYDDIKDLYKNGRIGNGLDGLNDKVLVPLADKWKKLITEWSPIFMVKNAMRDFPEAIINSRSRKEFLSITADGSALKDLLNHGEFSKALQDAGISASTFIDIDKAVKAFEKGEGGLKTLIPRLNAGVEMYPRLVEYMATIKKAGYDLKTVKISDIPMEIRDMAAANAADVTVNFGRSGSVDKLINKGAIPFFNPSIQGWSKFARNISELDGFKDTVGFLLSATALGAAPMVATNLLYQNNPNYQQISARDKANNYIIAIPPLDDKADTFIKIPRSRFASVYGLPLVNVANENKMGWADALHVANDQVAPLNPFESHLGANLIQAARNKTWYGTPIESEAMQSLPANERYDATTSGISIGTAKALNKATKGKVKVSPKKLDYVLDANFGVVADFALPMTTKAKQGQNPIGQFVNVGKRAFTIDSATQNDLSTRYYDQASRLEQNKNSSEATEADKTAYKKFSSWDSRIKGVTNAMRYVQASDMPNKQEAYRELAKLRNEDMKKALNGKVSLNNTRDIDIIHKYAGNSYTIENLGKSADKNALKAYGAAVYGNLSEDEMKKKIDSDTEFYKGYSGILKTQNALQKVSPKLKGSNALTYAVGLADAGANDDVFSAYGTTLQSRTETASKAQRAKDYLKNNGSVAEFAQLENAVKNLGKLSDVDRDKLEDEAYEKLERGEMSIDEYKTELKKIEYNANQSYVGKAVSLAMSGAPTRAYALYDIKEKNVQKGYNLAAMGIDSRKYREMSQACDTDGNGYLKTAEIRDYVANSDVEDKATLFDALCYYSNVRNPFGTPTHYSVEEAAEAGRRNGVTQIKVNAGEDNSTLAKDKSSGSGWYGGYYRRGYGGWHRWRHYGSGKKKKKEYTAPKIKQSTYKASQRHYKDLASSLQTRSGSTALPTTTTKIEPPKVKFKKYEV